MSKGQRHHYIPEFYLKQWGDPKLGGQLFEYCKRYEGLVARPTHPAGTGYVPGLYTFSELDDAGKNFLEDVFLLTADTKASIALQRLLAHDLDLSIELQSSWSRFLMTLMFRNPEAVARLRTTIATGLPSALKELRAEWETARRPDHPETFEEYAAAMPRRDTQQAALMLLRGMMDNKNIGQFLNRMVWGVLTFNRQRYPLLISDRPYLMTNGIDKPNGHIASSDPNTTAITLSSSLKDDRWPDFHRVPQCAAATPLTDQRPIPRLLRMGAAPAGGTWDRRATGSRRCVRCRDHRLSLSRHVQG